MFSRTTSVSAYVTWLQADNLKLCPDIIPFRTQPLSTKPPASTNVSLNIGEDNKVLLALRGHDRMLSISYKEGGLMSGRREFDPTFTLNMPPLKTLIIV